MKGASILQFGGMLSSTSGLPIGTGAATGTGAGGGGAEYRFGGVLSTVETVDTLISIYKFCFLPIGCV